MDDLLEALSRQKRKPQPAAEGILIIYEEGRFRDALEKAAALRADGVPTELIPASVASRTAQDSAFADRIRIYREKAGRICRRHFIICHRKADVRKKSWTDTVPGSK